MNVPNAVLKNRVIAVIRVNEAEDYFRVIPALLAGGIRLLEVTLTTPGTIEALPAIKKLLPKDALLGVGTIRTREQATEVLANGVGFIVSPHLDAEIVKLAVEHNVPVFPGCVTPTEINFALAAGATAIKLFPAGATSPSLAKQLLGPFPEMQFMPSGGMSLDDVAPWLKAGAVAVCVGGPLVGTSDTPVDEITRRAKAYVEAASSVAGA